jgi:DhnA family fructose-bisphosphate aldolase class Ia
MNGLKRNRARLFGERDRLFVAALDHSQGGVVPGLETPSALLAKLAATPVDGFILNVGLADLMAEKPFIHKLFILRTSFGGSQIADDFTNVHANHVSPETARRLGADAVLMMFAVGGADHRSVQEAAADIDAYHALDIPVIAEIIASDFAKTISFDIQYHGARMAAELGADVVKAFFVDGFERVVAACPAPLILAGGPKGRDIVEVAAKALELGVKGFAFGRNIFQHPDPAAAVAEIDALFAARGGATVAARG